jgi:hypothetical protein
VWAKHRVNLITRGIYIYHHLSVQHANSRFLLHIGVSKRVSFVLQVENNFNCTCATPDKLHTNPLRSAGTSAKGGLHAAIKRQVRPIICHEDTQVGSTDSSTLSLISALDGGGLLTSRPERFIPGNNLVPFEKEVRWAPGPLRTDAESLTPAGIPSPDRRARSESLYRPSYSGLQTNMKFNTYKE